MKKEIGVPAIVGAVVLVALLLFGMYRMFMRPSATVNQETASKIPDYARQSREGGAPSTPPAPNVGGAQGGAPAGGAPPGGMPSYGPPAGQQSPPGPR